MKVKDADILIIPGYTNSGPDHWQTGWEQKLSTARRVEQAEWSKPVRQDWTAAVANAVNQAEKPVVLVAHSLGVAAAIQAIPLFRKPVAGGFFVAPPDTPADRVEAIRSALTATLQDPEFLAAATQARLSIRPASAAEITDKISAVLTLSDDRRALVSQLLGEETR